MHSKASSISLYYLAVVLQGAKRLNYDTQRLLLKSGFDHSILEAEPDSERVSANKITALIRSIWRTMDDEFMGFTQQPCKQGVFAIMAKQAIACKSLKEALIQGTHFYHHVRNDITLSFEEKDQEAILTFDLKQPFLDPDHFLVEFFLLIWHRFSNWLVGQRVPLKYANFSYPAPSHVKEYSLLYPCHCRFNQVSNSIVFEKQSLALPIKQHERELAIFLKNSPADLLSKPVFYRSITTQVMNLIGSVENEAFPSIEKVAYDFNMSSRNLRRRLKEEDTSYQQIKNTLRQDRAIALLDNNNLAINQIARKLGFNEPAAFTRAFKQWSGESPRVYRKRRTMTPH
jgi:AraC-like DNA-binding protein